MRGRKGPSHDQGFAIVFLNCGNKLLVLLKLPHDEPGMRSGFGRRRADNEGFIAREF
jgi:hypothetical protein